MRPWQLGDRVHFHDEDQTGTIVTIDRGLFFNSVGTTRVEVEYELGHTFWFRDTDLVLARSQTV
jgi:hypothetical protein